MSTQDFGNQPTVPGPTPSPGGSPTPGSAPFDPTVHGSTTPGSGSGGNLELPEDLPVAVADLTQDKLILAAGRMTVGGKPVPALAGIPLLAKLGQGGMGAVYLGIHPRLRKIVAMKILPFTLAEQDPGMIERFYREAQIAARVESPHLVRVMDVNQDPSGLFYLVMEFVSGISAGSLLRTEAKAGRRGLNEALALDLCIAATTGLCAAHAENIVHRDIKPDNILIPRSPTGELEHLKSKLADLGLARGEDLGQSLTGAQSALGTPGYMAPEQAMDAKHAGKPADVFSLGATLYAFLTGQAPFTASNLGRALLDTIQQPHVPVQSQRPDTSPGTAAVIDRCLMKDAGMRFTDARDLLEALKRAREALGVTQDQQATFVPRSNGPQMPPVLPPQMPSSPPPFPVSMPSPQGLPAPLAGSFTPPPSQQPFTPAPNAPQSWPPPQAPAPAKSNAGVLVGILALVLLLAGGGVGAYFYFRTPPQAPSSVYTVRPAINPNEPETPTPTPTEPPEELFGPDQPVVEIPTNDVQGKLMAFVVALQNGDRKKAEQIYQQAKAINPKDPLVEAMRSALDPKGDPNAVITLLRNPDKLDILNPEPPKNIDPNKLELFYEGEYPAHTGGVGALVLNSQAGRVVTGGKDGALKVWTEADDKVQATLTGHVSLVTAIALTPDGRYAATGSLDTTVRFWDLSENRQLYEFKGHSQPVHAVAMDVRGLLVATAVKDGHVRLFDTVTATLLKEFTEHKVTVRALAFVPGTSKLATGGDGANLLLWDFRAGTSALLRGHNKPIRAIAVSSDGTRLLSVGGGGEALLWNLSKMEVLSKLSAGEAELTCAAFSPDGKYAVVGAADGQVRAFDVAHKVKVGTAAKAHTGAVTGVTLDDGYEIISTGEDGKLKRWALPDLGDK